MGRRNEKENTKAVGWKRCWMKKRRENDRNSSSSTYKNEKKRFIESSWMMKRKRTEGRKRENVNEVHTISMDLTILSLGSKCTILQMKRCSKYEKEWMGKNERVWLCEREKAHFIESHRKKNIVTAWIECITFPKRELTNWYFRIWPANYIDSCARQSTVNSNANTYFLCSSFAVWLISYKYQLCGTF